MLFFNYNIGYVPHNHTGGLMSDSIRSSGSVAGDNQSGRKGSYVQSVLRDDFGTLLRNGRKAKGYTQIQMAELLNVTQPCYQSWEAGQRIPRLVRLFQIARVLSVPVSSFIREEKRLRFMADNGIKDPELLSEQETMPENGSEWITSLPLLNTEKIAALSAETASAENWVHQTAKETTFYLHVRRPQNGELFAVFIRDSSLFNIEDPAHSIPPGSVIILRSLAKDEKISGQPVCLFRFADGSVKLRRASCFTEGNSENDGIQPLAVAVSSITPMSGW